MAARAPQKPGIYTSRWRLRDYSKPAGKSQGFGPKVELSLRVLSCNQPTSCGCRVWCSNGKSHDLTADIDSGETCKAVGATYCKPEAEYVSHSFQSCTGVDPDPASDPAGDPAAPADPDAPGNEWIANDPDDDGVLEPTDDPDFEDDGFDGHDGPDLPDAREGGGCSVASAASSDATALFALGTLIALVLRRRRFDQENPS
jgi:MYXO-CTERM domain-containing protein